MEATELPEQEIGDARRLVWENRGVERRPAVHSRKTWLVGAPVHSSSLFRPLRLESQRCGPGSVWVSLVTLGGHRWLGFQLWSWDGRFFPWRIATLRSSPGVAFVRFSGAAAGEAVPASARRESEGRRRRSWRLVGMIAGARAWFAGSSLGGSKEEFPCCALDEGGRSRRARKIGYRAWGGVC